MAEERLPQLASAKPGTTSDLSELQNALAAEAAEDIAGAATAIANVMEPLARHTARADVEKARIQNDGYCHMLNAQLSLATRQADQRHARFKWIAAIGTLFGVLLLGITVALIVKGQTMAGLMVVSHAVALVAGLVGGRGLVPKTPSGDGANE